MHLFNYRFTIALCAKTDVFDVRDKTRLLSSLPSLLSLPSPPLTSPPHVPPSLPSPPLNPPPLSLSLS